MVQRYPVMAAVMEGRRMQVNELVGQVWQGTRLPDIDRAFNDTRAKLEIQPVQRGADESRRAIPKPVTTRTPRRYGAGF